MIITHLGISSLSTMDDLMLLWQRVSSMDQFLKAISRNPRKKGLLFSIFFGQNNLNSLFIWKN